MRLDCMMVGGAQRPACFARALEIAGRVRLVRASRIGSMASKDGGDMAIIALSITRC